MEAVVTRPNINEHLCRVEIDGEDSIPAWLLKFVENCVYVHVYVCTQAHMCV
jgi:hypothetical protein